jgi:hypothetical protein
MRGSLPAGRQEGAQYKMILHCPVLTGMAGELHLIFVSLKLGPKKEKGWQNVVKIE